MAHMQSGRRIVLWCLIVILLKFWKDTYKRVQVGCDMPCGAWTFWVSRHFEKNAKPHSLEERQLQDFQIGWDVGCRMAHLLEQSTFNRANESGC